MARPDKTQETSSKRQQRARAVPGLGRAGEALQYYLKAKDQDICPLRILKRHEQILSAIAAGKTPPATRPARIRIPTRT